MYGVHICITFAWLTSFFTQGIEPQARLNNYTMMSSNIVTRSKTLREKIYNDAPCGPTMLSLQ